MKTEIYKVYKYHLMAHALTPQAEAWRKECHSQELDFNDIEDIESVLMDTWHLGGEASNIAQELGKKYGFFEEGLHYHYPDPDSFEWKQLEMLLDIVCWIYNTNDNCTEDFKPEYTTWLNEHFEDINWDAKPKESDLLWEGTLRAHLWSDILGLGGDDDVDYNGGYIYNYLDLIRSYHTHVGYPLFRYRRFFENIRKELPKDKAYSTEECIQYHIKKMETYYSDDLYEELKKLITFEEVDAWETKHEDDFIAHS